MPLIPAAIQQELELALFAAFLKEFAKEAAADPTSYQRQAKAIAEGVAQVLIKAITTQAIVTGGGTLGPGKIT